MDNFIETKIEYRNKLGMNPQTKEEKQEQEEWKEQNSLKY